MMKRIPVSRNTFKANKVSAFHNSASNWLTFLFVKIIHGGARWIFHCSLKYSVEGGVPA